MSDSAPSALRRHFGKHPIILLTASALMGLGIGMTAQLTRVGIPQDTYPARKSDLNWHTTSPGLGGSVLINLGRLANGNAPWSEEKQAKLLRCAGLDVEITALIGSVSLASQPDGWLSMDGVAPPDQVKTANEWLDRLSARVPGSAMDHISDCKVDSSWASPEWRDLGKELLEGDKIDINAWIQQREVLRNLAGEQHLAQLTLGSALRNNEGLEQAISSVKRAGERLRRATRQSWGLGLNGRISLVLLDSDPKNPIAGVTRTRVARAGQTPLIEIVAETESKVLLHEWFHALDMTVAPLATHRAAQGQAWSNQRRWRKKDEQNIIEKAWSTASLAHTSRSEWVWAQRTKSFKEKNLYWINESEAQAYAFQEWDRHDLNDISCQKEDVEQRDGARPTVGDSACMAQAWKGYWAPLAEALKEP